MLVLILHNITEYDQYYEMMLFDKIYLLQSNALIKTTDSTLQIWFFE
jgi:hypothetical protein